MKQKTDPKINLSALQEALELGFIIALPPVLLAFLGVFLDKVLHLKPLCTIVFILLGTLLGILTAIKETKEILDKLKPPSKK